MTERRHTLVALMAITGLVMVVALALPTMGQSTPPVAPAAPVVMVANQQYDSWAPFGVDASSTLTMINRDASGTVLSDAVQTQTVSTLSDEALTLATQATYHVGGQDYPSDVMNVDVPAMVPEAGPPPAGTQMNTVVSPNTQSITVPAGTFDCTLRTTTAIVTVNNQTFTTVARFWTNPDVPGSLVQMISEMSAPTGDTVMTYELTDFTIGVVPAPVPMVDNPEYAKWAPFAAGASATFSHVTLDAAGTEVGSAIAVWTLNDVTADAVTVSDAFTTSPGTPDEFTCGSANAEISAKIPATTGGGNPLATTAVAVAAATETITVPAGTFDCTLTTTTTTVAMPSGQPCTIVTQEWTNDTLPGMLVKTASTIDAGAGKITTVMQLTAFTLN